MDLTFASPPQPVRDWSRLPAEQQPTWHDHRARQWVVNQLRAAPPLVRPAETAALGKAMASVAGRQGLVLQIGDCAESFTECSRAHVRAKLRVLDQLAAHLHRSSGLPAVRIGRIAGQLAKPRSSPAETVDGTRLPVFRGHLVNSEHPSPIARQHDPHRMLTAYSASAAAMEWVRRDRDSRGGWGDDGLATGPWTSHEALVIDYEAALMRGTDHDRTSYLGSTHLPWIGERTRQPDGAHLRLMECIANPVGCKIGPSATPRSVTGLCRRLDPDRVPGRLTLIARMGHDRINQVLPELVKAVADAGHQVVWLCDPMHGNTIRCSSGLKTRYLSHLITEALRFNRILERAGQHPGGLHLEVAADDVTECVDGVIVPNEAALPRRYTTLCDPRLNPRQAMDLISAVYFADDPTPPVLTGGSPLEVPDAPSAP